MQEINPIARLTVPTEPSPTPQPKSQNSFTSLLEALLGNAPGAGDEIETISEGTPSLAVAKSMAPIGLKLSSDTPEILTDSPIDIADLTASSTTPSEANPPKSAGPDSSSLHSNLVPQPPAVLPPLKMPVRAINLSQDEIGSGKQTTPAKAAAGVPVQDSMPNQLLAWEIPGKSVPVPSTVAVIPDGKSVVNPAEANSAVQTLSAILQVKPEVSPTPGNSAEIQPAGPGVDPLPETPIRLFVTTKPAPPAKNAVPVSQENSINGQSVLLDLIGQLAAGQHAAAEPHRSVLLESRSESVVSTPGNSVLPAAEPAEPRVPEMLNLADFGVTRFEYKSEFETHLPPEIQSMQVMQMMRNSNPVRELRPVKPMGSDSDAMAHGGGSQFAPMDRPSMIASPDAVQHVRLVFEPPAPPPVVRSVSMDIGDPESQVRVVIRERNGNLNVQFGSSNERLRMDLQTSGPLLMRELQRNNPMAVTLDFSNFGSATDADSQPRSQSQAKKPLKSDAEFADVAETAYLPDSSPALKSL